jgi:Lon protease-like protein
VSLPRLIPLFPLPSVVLFPQVLLPLHIFEPRYRQMVKDVAVGDELIGMILLRGEEDPTGSSQDVYTVGCAGRMVRKIDLPDGRSNILLQGVRAFVVREQQFERLYRVGVVDWLPPVERDFRLAADTRQRLVSRIRGALGEKQEGMGILNDPSVNDEMLVNLFAFALDFPVAEKQSLLEVANPSARADRLIDTLEFHALEREFSPSIESSKLRVQ